jgi:hypothetical protein
LADAFCDADNGMSLLLIINIMTLQSQVPGLLKIWLEVMTRQVPNNDGCKDLPRKMPIMESLRASLVSAVRNAKIKTDWLLMSDIQDQCLGASGHSNNQKSRHYL